MKGSSCSAALRIRVAAIFAVAFLAGAIVIFGLASLVGAAFRAAGLPLEWRVLLAAASLAALACVDLLAVKKDCYCPLGWRRQTPKSLGRRHAVTTVAAAWGFDTGLAVTTFRVAAVTWGALVLAGLGLSAWWIGVGYGFGFVLPLLLSIAAQTPDAGSRLESLLGKRALVQSGSAAVLFIAGALLLIRHFGG